jgi:hypothetical protein
MTGQTHNQFGRPQHPLGAFFVPENDFADSLKADSADWLTNLQNRVSKSAESPL